MQQALPDRGCAPKLWVFLFSHFSFVGGHPPTPPAPPIFARPRLLRVLPRFWVPLGWRLVRVSNSSLVFILGHVPQGSLGRGYAPSTPNFCPPSFAEGFAEVLGPTR